MRHSSTFESKHLNGGNITNTLALIYRTIKMHVQTAILSVSTSFPVLNKGGEIRDAKTLNLPRNIVSFQVFGRCFSFFTLQDQLVAQQKHLLRVEEMQHADWLICSVWIQDGGITTNLLRDELRL